MTLHLHSDGRWYSIIAEDVPTCGASVTISDRTPPLIRCALPDSHPGHHDDGDGVTWTGRWMKPATARTCPHCGASPVKSRPHCDRCDWRRCLACKGLYNDTTRKTATQEES